MVGMSELGSLQAMGKLLRTLLPKFCTDTQHTVLGSSDSYFGARIVQLAAEKLLAPGPRPTFL